MVLHYHQYQRQDGKILNRQNPKTTCLVLAPAKSFCSLRRPPQYPKIAAKKTNNRANPNHPARPIQRRRMFHEYQDSLLVLRAYVQRRRRERLS